MNKFTLIKTPVLVLLILVFLVSPIYALSLTKESKMSKEYITALIPGKIFSLDTVNIANKNGRLFFMTRDVKSRKIYWYVIDPEAEKVIAGGDCPFQVFTSVSFSPDGSRAAVITRYPTALWWLDVKSKEWRKVFQNPKKSGLAISPISPIIFTGNKFFSVLDKWDDTHTVTDTFVTRFTPPVLTPKNIVSVSSILWITAKKLMKKSKVELTGNLRVLRFADENNFAFTFELMPVKYKSKNLSISLLIYNNNPPNFARIDEGDLIIPMDYKTGPDRVLYTYRINGKNSVKYFKGGKSRKLMESEGLTGSIMNNGIIGISTVQGKKLAIYLGTEKEKMQKVHTFDEINKVGFLENGEKMIAISPRQITVYKINK